MPQILYRTTNKLGEVIQLQPEMTTRGRVWVLRRDGAVVERMGAFGFEGVCDDASEASYARFKELAYPE